MRKTITTTGEPSSCHLKIFVRAKNDYDATAVFSEVVNIFGERMCNYVIENTEQYWKFDDVIIVKGWVWFDSAMCERECKILLSLISNKWIFWGEPMNEALTSSNTEGCIISIMNIELIHIFFEKDEERQGNA